MLADKPLLVEANADRHEEERGVARPMLWFNPSASAGLLPTKGEDGWTALLDYAAFLLARRRG